MPFEPKLIAGGDEMRRSDKTAPLGHEPLPLEPELFGPDADFSELPDKLAELAFQLSEDAELLAQCFPPLPAEGGVQRSSRQDSSPSRRMWLASPWTRAAALLLLFSAATLGVLLLGGDEEPGVAGARFRQTLNLNRPAADVPSPERFAESKAPGKTSVAPESSTMPVFISADDAEFLNGEKIEVLADVHAEQLAEI